jgi:oxalate decarboxylase/phosphoglucose isomerase-like protein (cupin superfamily)
VITRRGIFCKESRSLHTMMHWQLDVGASEGLHAHGGPQSDRPQLGALEEAYYCLSGRGSVQIQGATGAVQDIPLAPGDAVMIAAGVMHGVRNEGEIPLSMLVWWAPPQDGEILRTSQMPGTAAVLIGY